MADDVVRALETGVRNVRVDFDTSVGDETYTMLKQSLPMTQRLVSLVAPRLPDNGTLRLFFPDAGTAAMMVRDWRVGTNESLVPANVAFSGMRRDSPEPTDAGILVLCPRNSEADDTLRLVEEVAAAGQFMLLVNPELVNMATTGYGLAGRRIRDLVLAKFTSAYYLRTLTWGAVAKRLGKSYSVWQEDDALEAGYRLLRNVDAKPTFEDLEEIYDEENGLSNRADTPAFLNAFADFMRDFGRL
ncbi:hypothetical protein JKP88DRAFT_258823 [Tribonema minus]|uniref:DUF1995 domain-containing protein n=1 Tax=Tribonema minus TaxID=303371 RepID=A0A835YKF2_9STRA|nr:hypothetical protein JKP88DRAFT_258823 [Tribonema minus]